tara:strand:+ start:83 stop:1228 length:1146 start_codon:yes stop_codon:yes gene_type:complete
MLFFKKVISLIIILFVTFFFILVFLEIYASINKNKFPSYSWQINNIMEEKVNNCKKKPLKLIGVFGDSSVEYHGENSSNIVKQLEKKFNNHSLCNFGISGNEPTVYINRFLFALENNIKFDKAIFYFYEGNDFSSFRYFRNTKDFDNKKIGYVNGIFNYNSQNVNDRKLSAFKKFIKSTYSLNIIYREVFKKYFFSIFSNIRINEKFVKKVYDRGDQYFEVSIKDAIQRMKSTPMEVKKVLSSDMININLYKLALRNPNYYFENHNPTTEDFITQKKIAFHHIDFINSLCQKNKIDCKFIVVPSPVFLFKGSKEIWKNNFRFNYYPNFGPSSIVRALSSKYNNFHYPEGVLEYTDYIYADNHLTGKGNNKLANFTYKRFAN